MTLKRVTHFDYVRRATLRSGKEYTGEEGGKKDGAGGGLQVEVGVNVVPIRQNKWGQVGDDRFPSKEEKNENDLAPAWKGHPFKPVTSALTEREKKTGTREGSREEKIWVVAGASHAEEYTGVI